MEVQIWVSPKEWGGMNQVYACLGQHIQQKVKKGKFVRVFQMIGEKAVVLFQRLGEMYEKNPLEQHSSNQLEL